jgi:hypothetical protein
MRFRALLFKHAPSLRFRLDRYQCSAAETTARAVTTDVDDDQRQSIASLA